jgi:hypothetical protein
MCTRRSASNAVGGESSSSFAREKIVRFAPTPSPIEDGAINSRTEWRSSVRPA